MNKVTLFLFFMIFSASLSGCSTTINNHQGSLYIQLGEEQGISRLVDSFIKELAKDKQVFPYFAKASVSHFRKGFINHMCDISGGPCKYKGDNMVNIHTGMNINEADFNRVVELLVKAMEKEDISYRTQNKLLAKLAPLRSEVIKR